MYVVGISSPRDVNEYDLSIAWDVTTASFLQAFSVNLQEVAAVGLFFKPDGLKMYVMGYSGDDINEYDLSTAWDISTASFLQLFSVAAQELNPNGLFFKPDGLKMYIVGTTGDDVNEYDLSTAWNVTTASYLQSFSVAAQDTNPHSLFFKDDGLKMYIAGTTGDDINEYDLSTAWDVSTAVYLQNFSVVGQASQTCAGLFFKPDGSKMYVVGGTAAAIFEYDLANIPAITLPAAVVGLPSTLSAYDRVTYEFYTLDSGTTVNLIAEEVIAT
jgi:DNA-binding beta-propeller fold protein YncE